MNPEGGEEHWLNKWEQECAESIENQPNFEQSVVTESNSAHTKIWSAFQGSATAVAQLYRGIKVCKHSWKISKKIKGFLIVLIFFV